MIVNLLNTSDDRKVLDKTITNIKQINATPTGVFSLLNPSLIIEYDSDVLNANYCYIPDFNRYYYISISFDVGKKMIINCSIDVLKTYNNQIRQRTGTILRSESIGKPTAIVDNKLPVDPNRHELKTLKILPQNGLPVFGTNTDYVLATVGNNFYSGNGV